MASNDIRSSNLWTGVHIVVILACAVQVLYPPARQFKPFTLAFGLVLLPLYFFLLVRGLKQDKTGDLSVGQIYTQVKGGRRLPKLDRLQWAASIALILMTILSSPGPA